MDICPKSELLELPFNDTKEAGGRAVEWSECGSIIQGTDCVEKLGYSGFPSSRPIYRPSELPSPGTERLTTREGEVTAPPSGWTYTWPGASTDYVITAFSPTGTTISGPASTGPESTPSSGDSQTEQSSETDRSSLAESSSPSPTSAASHSSVHRMMLWLFTGFACLNL